MKRDDLLVKLEAVTVPAGPINNLAQVFNDPQVVHRGMKLELPSDEAVGGNIPGVRTPIVIDDAPMASPNPRAETGPAYADRAEKKSAKRNRCRRHYWSPSPTGG